MALQGIRVSFTRSGETPVDLKTVQSVDWGAQLSAESLVNSSSRAGKKVRSLTIRGYINNGVGTGVDNVTAQEQLETDLINIGVGTLSYTGMTDIADVRFESIEWESYRGNPIAKYTLTFVTETQNIHAHSPVKIGDITLNAASGFEGPRVSDKITAQGPDEQVSNLRARKFTITARMVANDLNTLNQKQVDLIEEVENKDTVVITLSVGAAPFVGSYTVRTVSLSFESPEEVDQTVSRVMTYECMTHDDYGKEPYTLGESAASFGVPSQQIDVVQSIDHNVTWERIGSGNEVSITEETYTVSGKVYFANATRSNNWSDYTTLRDTLNSAASAQTGRRTLATANNTLYLDSVKVGSFERDGNSTVDNRVRYSTTVSLIFKWKKSDIQTSYLVTATAQLGMIWWRVSSATRAASIDDFGNVTSRSITLTGKILGANLGPAEALLGTSQTFDGRSYYISNIVVGGTDSMLLEGNETKVHNVTVTASELDNATKLFHYLTGDWVIRKDPQTNATINLSKVTNRSKSIANRYDSAESAFVVTSITISVSGEYWSNDNSGSPTNPNALVDIFNNIDSRNELPLSQRVANQHNSSTDLLPTNTGPQQINYFFNNFNLGNWEPFTDEATGNAKWKQTVSLSATAVFDLSGGSSSEPTYIDSRSTSIIDENLKYSSLNVLGFGTKFKATGVRPSTIAITIQRQYRDAGKFIPNDLPSGSGFSITPVGTDNWDWGPANAYVTKEGPKYENRGLTNRQSATYSANKARDDL